MKCHSCRKDETPITSSVTGISYCPNCAAVLGRAYDVQRKASTMIRHEAITEIIRITRQRLAGLISREAHEAQIQAITTREPELPLEINSTRRAALC